MVVSLTVTAMMCAKLLKAHERNKQQNWLSRALQGGFDWIAEGYASTPRWVLRHQPLMLCVLLGTVCLAVYLYIIIVPKGFFPQQDAGRLSGQAVTGEDALDVIPPKTSPAD